MSNPDSLSSNSHLSKLEITNLLEKIQSGYTNRDISQVQNWIEELFDENVTIIGTNAVKPGDFEWRKGHEAAVEMFSSDWKNWGDVEMNLKEVEIDIEEECAWISMYATVTRDTTQSERHSSEVSKKRSLQRIKEYSEKDWNTTRALNEIIYDASLVLTQYERSETFVWPIRITLGLHKQDEKWLIRQVHFSFPSRGFPAVRLLEEE